MYVPAWQGLTLRHFTSPGRETPVPFPLGQSGHGFHTARSAIYQLFKMLVASGRTRVLAPDYHMGNELRAIRAAGAQGADGLGGEFAERQLQLVLDGVARKLALPAFVGLPVVGDPQRQPHWQAFRRANRRPGSGSADFREETLSPALQVA